MICRVFSRREDNGGEFVFGTKTKIAVVSNASASGSTLIATSLAWILSRGTNPGGNRKISGSVAFVEAADYIRKHRSHENMGMLYDSLGMEQRFVSRHYHDLFKMCADNMNIRGVLNVDEKINWAVPKADSYTFGHNHSNSAPSGNAENEFEIMQKVINNISGDIVICDIGSCLSKSELKEVLAEMDEIIFVINPYPSKILAGDERLGTVRLAELNSERGHFHYIVNNATNGINRNELRKYLREKGIKDALFIEETDTAELHSAEYCCAVPCSKKRIADTMLPLKEMIKF